ncbi:hypothetical protein SASPL_108718 [Salvia splendens]|uniref:No apical meristem-associated C-terminal domain-containing protein n=1 Tax=Salvia splendens TaxID=180675 RepID=A0A8X9A7Q2_SALSN|nr:hypothetical protein SASPL_108718 [Salvia splendens]
MSVRKESYTENEDILLCKVYMEISQDPSIGTSQSAQRFWQRVEDGFNQAEERDPTWPERSSRQQASRGMQSSDSESQAHTLHGSQTLSSFPMSCDDSEEQILGGMKQANDNMSMFLKQQKNNHDLKTMKEENKIMAMDLSSIVDPDSRAYFQAERRRILQKRAQQLEQPNDYETGTYPSYFDNIGGSGSGLPDY